MKEIAFVLSTANALKAERLAARAAFLERRAAIWDDIQAARFRYIDNAKWQAQIESAPKEQT